MKTNFFPKKFSFLAACVFIFFLSGCSKSSDTAADPGYGCGTQAIIQTIPATAAVLVYVPVQTKWVISLDLPGNIYIACEACGNSNEIANITAGHSLTDIINITVSGKIKNRIANQASMSTSNGSYREIYLMDINSVNQ